MKMKRLIRAEIIRLRWSKLLCVIIAVYALITLAAIQTRGAWAFFQSSDGLIMGYFPNPFCTLVKGADLMAVAPLAHSMFFPAVMVFAVGIIIKDALDSSACAISLSRGASPLKLLSARCAVVVSFLLSIYIVYSIAFAVSMPFLFGAALSKVAWGHFAGKLLLCLLLEASYAIILVVAVSLMGSSELVLGFILMATYIGLLITEFTGFSPVSHVACLMVACGPSSLEPYIIPIVFFSVISAAVAFCFAVLIADLRCQR